MSTFKNFTELECWKGAVDLYNQVYQLTKNMDEIRHNYSLIDQLKRAALSISNNIAEGFGRHTDKDFLRFLNIANGSCFEVESMIIVMSRVQIISEGIYDQLMTLVLHVRKTLSGLMKYLSRSLLSPDSPTQQTK